MRKSTAKWARRTKRFLLLGGEKDEVARDYRANFRKKEPFERAAAAAASGPRILAVQGMTELPVDQGGRCCRHPLLEHKRRRGARRECLHRLVGDDPKRAKVCRCPRFRA